MHLIDASALITAKRDYYPPDRFPQYWEWIIEKAAAGLIKMPAEVWEELIEQDDWLAEWAKENADALLLNGVVYDGYVAQVLACYGPDISEADLEFMGADPFLIAAAMAIEDAVVVSKEVSRPSAQGRNRKVPDVCTQLNVVCINDHGLIRELDFKLT